MTVIEKPQAWPATLPHLVTEVPGPKALAQVAADQAVVSNSLPRAYPFAPVRGFGMGVEDQDGNVFLDFCAGIAVNSTGHCHPRVVDAVVQQAQRLLHYSASDFYEQRYQELASALAATAPWSGPSKVLLQNSGTEAVEASIKLARYMSGRQWIVGFVGGFHGRTLGALTLTNSKAKYHAHFGPLAPGFLHVPFGSHGLDELEERIIARTIPGDEIAAFVVEPVQGEGGYVVPDEDFFPRLKQIADKYCIAIVVDEVQSGVGRTGKMWAIEHFGIEPDIVAAAKGLGSGMPIGAVIAKEHWMRWKQGSHGSTFGGNLLAMAAGNAVLDEVTKPGFLDHVRTMALLFKQRLAEIKDRYPAVIAEVRGEGLLIGVRALVPAAVLVDALRASYALPGVFDPVKLGGRWLMDGALVNPVPVTVARE